MTPLPAELFSTGASKSFAWQIKQARTTSGLARRLLRTSGRRNADRFETRMGPRRAGLKTVEVGAGIGARQVQHLAAELPVFLDLRLGLGRAPRELAVLPASL